MVLDVNIGGVVTVFILESLAVSGEGYNNNVQLLLKLLVSEAAPVVFPVVLRWPGVDGVVTVTSFEYLELPLSLKALTRYS